MNYNLQAISCTATAANIIQPIPIMFDFNYKNTLCHSSFLARLAFTYQIRGLKISPVGGGTAYGIY